MAVENTRGGKSLVSKIELAAADSDTELYSAEFYSDKDFELEGFITLTGAVGNKPWVLERLLQPYDVSSPDWRTHKEYSGDKVEQIKMASSGGAYYRVKVTKADVGLATGQTFKLDLKLSR